MIRTLLTSRTFWISLIAGFLGLFIMDHGVQGFQYFVLWTKNQNTKISENYIPDGLIDDAALGTVIAQIYQSPSMISRDGIYSKSAKLFYDTKKLIDINIVQMLKTSKNPRTTLDLHIAHLNKKITEIEQLGDQLQTLSDNAMETSKQCLGRKRDGDKLFLEGLTDNNAILLQQGLENSVEDAPCYITNRIYANAYSYIRQRLLSYNVALKRRLSILEQNKEPMIRYADRLDEPVDMELRALQARLGQLRDYELQVSRSISSMQMGGSSSPNTVSDDFSSFFLYGFPDDSKPVPKLNIRFNDNNVNVPNFEQGAFKKPSANPIRDSGF